MAITRQVREALTDTFFSEGFEAFNLENVVVCTIAQGALHAKSMCNFLSTDQLLSGIHVLIQCLTSMQFYSVPLTVPNSETSVNQISY